MNYGISITFIGHINVIEMPPYTLVATQSRNSHIVETHFYAVHMHL